MQNHTSNPDMSPHLTVCALQQLPPPPNPPLPSSSQHPHCWLPAVLTLLHLLLPHSSAAAAAAAAAAADAAAAAAESAATAVTVQALQPAAAMLLRCQGQIPASVKQPFQ
jgi:hypothetical protein